MRLRIGSGPEKHESVSVGLCRIVRTLCCTPADNDAYTIEQ